MTAIELYNKNKNSLKHRDLTLSLFKFNTKRDKVKKDNFYIFSTNFASGIGKWHKLGLFWVEKTEGTKIHCFNLLYIEKKYLEVFLKKGLNSDILNKLFSYTKIIIDSYNIVRSELMEKNGIFEQKVFILFFSPNCLLLLV